MHAGNEDKLRSTISAHCGTVAASAVKFSSKTPVTGKQLHLRADHVHTARLRYIQRHKLAKGIENVSLRTEHCGPCGLAKNFRKHVPHTSDRPPSARPLELVHMDSGVNVLSDDLVGERIALGGLDEEGVVAGLLGAHFRKL